MALSPLPDRTIADAVADRIREAIIDGRYSPGTRLVERKLAAELGVSHIPVREALARLTDEGLVTHQPRRGARVASLSRTEVEEIASLRTLLEQFVIVRVQERMTPAVEAELRKLVETMEQAAERGNVRRVFDLDERFHERLWALADHRMLLELVAQLRGKVSAFLRAATAALDAGELVEHARSHATLLDAILGGDADVARAATAAHIDAATARLVATLPDEG
jgi:DNA-binding GntR family transcriptional regulator